MKFQSDPYYCLFSNFYQNLFSLFPVYSPPLSFTFLLSTGSTILCLHSPRVFLQTFLSFTAEIDLSLTLLELRSVSYLSSPYFPSSQTSSTFEKAIANGSCSASLEASTLNFQVQVGCKFEMDYCQGCSETYLAGLPSLVLCLLGDHLGSHPFQINRLCYFRFDG